MVAASVYRSCDLQLFISLGRPPFWIGRQLRVRFTPFLWSGIIRTSPSTCSQARCFFIWIAPSQVNWPMWVLRALAIVELAALGILQSRTMYVGYCARFSAPACSRAKRNECLNCSPSSRGPLHVGSVHRAFVRRWLESAGSSWTHGLIEPDRGSGEYMAFQCRQCRVRARVGPPCLVRRGVEPRAF